MRARSPKPLYNGFFNCGSMASADMSDARRIGFLGTGKMATALAQGWLKAGLVEADQVRGSDPVVEARAAFAQATGGHIFPDNRQVVGASDVVVLAVKPQNMSDVLAEIAPEFESVKPLIVSIAAGVAVQ